MANLLDAMKQIEYRHSLVNDKKQAEIKIISEKYDKQLSELKIAYAQLKELNTACPECEGKGKYKEYSGQYEDRGLTVVCPVCCGNGIKKVAVNGT